MYCLHKFADFSTFTKISFSEYRHIYEKFLKTIDLNQ